MLQGWVCDRFRPLDACGNPRVLPLSECTALEILALRQQVALLKSKRRRPLPKQIDRLFWTSLRRLWSRWREVLIIVEPKTVIAWHRAGFRLYWRWRSDPLGGRPRITVEVRSTPAWSRRICGQ